MIRRRRPQREMGFSFDSFMDLVTNVVGIIIRLILVAWVGAQSYHSIPRLWTEDEPEPAIQAAKVADPKPITDPLQSVLDQEQAELAQTQDRLLAQLRQLGITHQAHDKTRNRLAALRERKNAVAAKQGRIAAAAARQGKPLRDVRFSLTSLKQRHAKLIEAIQAMEDLPTNKQQLRYRSPISKPVIDQEWHFECQNGRVAFINVPVMVQSIKSRLPEIERQLRDQWQIRDVSDPAGPFRLRYLVERRRSTLDTVFAGAPPDPRTSFAYSVEWEVEPMIGFRGESAEEAARPESQFRRVVDRFDTEQTSVTFWVYPDSFALYRQVRDYAADRGLTVAARPIPKGVLIGFSRKGTKSLGQ